MIQKYLLSKLIFKFVPTKKFKKPWNVLKKFKVKFEFKLKKLEQ